MLNHQECSQLINELHENKESLVTQLDSDVNLPKNPFTNEIYKSEDLIKYGSYHGFEDCRWLSKDDINFHNLSLKNEEKENPLVCDISIKNGTQYDVEFYNVEQLNNASFNKLPKYEKTPPKWEKDSKLESFIKNQDVKILHNSTSCPFYLPSKHMVCMPHESQYPTSGSYYNALFHELAHASVRELNLSPKDKNHQVAYDKEELIAEITAMKLCKKFDIKIDARENLGYLKGYWNRLNQGPKQIEVAVGESTKIASYMLDKHQIKEIKTSNNLFAKARQAAEQKLANRQAELTKQQQELKELAEFRAWQDSYITN